MKIEEFFYSTEEEFHAYYKAYNDRISKEAWLAGMYNRDALAVVLGNAFGGNKGKAIEYPDKPYGTEYKEEEACEIEEVDLQKKLCECY